MRPRVSLVCLRGPGWVSLRWPSHSPLLLPQACPTVFFLLPLPVTATATLFTVLLGRTEGVPARSLPPTSHTHPALQALV